VRPWLVASLAAAALIAAAPAHAAPFQFASFQSTNGNPFTWTNNGGTSGTLGVISSPTPITFNFLAGTNISNFDRAAHMSITATSTVPSTGGTFPDQPINNGGTFSIIEDSTGKNLLSGVFSAADLSGHVGGPNADVSSSTQVGYTITFTSDYLIFDNTQNSFDLGLANVNPLLSVGAGGFLSSFNANANGQFVGNVLATVPQPTSVAMFGTGMAATGLLAFRARRKRPVRG